MSTSDRRLVYERGLIGGLPSVVIQPPGKRVYFGQNLGPEGSRRDVMLKLSERELLGLIATLTGVEPEVG